MNSPLCGHGRATCRLSSHVLSQCVSVCVCHSVPRSACWQSVQMVNVLGTSLQPYSAWQALRTLRYISSWQFLRKLVPSFPILFLPPFLLPSLPSSCWSVSHPAACCNHLGAFWLGRSSFPPTWILDLSSSTTCTPSPPSPPTSPKT